MIASTPNTRRVASAMRLYSVEPLPMIFWSRVPKSASADSHATMSRMKVAAGECGVDGLAIGAGRGGDVGPALESAFDFEADDARVDERFDAVVGGEVLRAEEVGSVAEVAAGAVDDEVVGHAAGLGALAAIGAAAAECFAGEALAAVGDAECAVDEDLDRHLGLRRDRSGFRRAKVRGRGRRGRCRARRAKSMPRRLGERHLRRGVDGESRCDAMDEADESEVLHDDGVDSGGGDGGDEFGGGGEFVGEDQRVEGDEAADVAVVEKPHHLGEFLDGEVGGAVRGR